MLSQSKWPSEFLAFHLRTTFSNDRTKYEQFLTLIIGDHKGYLESRAEFLRNWIRHELSAPLKGQATRLENAPRQREIALAITYRQLAGTLKEWPPGQRTKEIGTIAKEHGLSADKLLKYYRDYHDGLPEKRLNSLKNQSLRSSIIELLRDDDKASLELKRDIDKIQDWS